MRQWDELFKKITAQTNAAAKETRETEEADETGQDRIFNAAAQDLEQRGRVRCHTQVFQLP